MAALELDALQVGERSGTFRFGKGNKQRWVPLPLPARRALQAYLETRPPVASNKVFIGERGPLTESGVRSRCDKYSASIGVRLHPHLLRHTFSHKHARSKPVTRRTKQLLPGDVSPMRERTLGHSVRWVLNHTYHLIVVTSFRFSSSNSCCSGPVMG
ncbi:MAG: tyrosine-type recombinase/integrase [Planctomycetota bacterium]|nr:tyrosine-type recombinase/integrase [Planctomycetota bacterium]